MKIRILGVGGFDNAGYPGNAFVIDGTYLFEAPPDIIQTCANKKIDIGSLEAVYVSHTHGDHVFGMPFLLFNIWRKNIPGKKLRIIGPKDLKRYVIELSSLSIRKDHPLVSWIENECVFETIDETSTTRLGSYSMTYFRTIHERETYGVSVSEKGILSFQYLADSKWDERLVPFFASGAKAVLCDIAGTNGITEVHASVSEIENGLNGKIDKATRVIGTHICCGIGFVPSKIEVAYPGMELSL